MEEILNIEYHVKRMTVKALNRAPTIPEAANLLGVSERCLHRWRINYKIQYDKATSKYFLPELSTVATDKKILTN